MNGIHEVVGSIPISSTKENKRLGACILPNLFVFRESVRGFYGILFHFELELNCGD